MTIFPKGRPLIGLMGVANDGTLISPSGKWAMKCPLWLACKIQRVQHTVARFSWKFDRRIP